jgi:hypothetical protein
MKNWFNRLSKRGKTIAIVSASLLSIGVVNAATNPTPDTSSPQNAIQSQSVQAETKPEVKKPVVTTKQEMQTAPLAFTESTASDASLEVGQTRVTEGQNGEKQTTFEVNYEDDKEVSRKETGSVITKEPVARITYSGSKAPAPITPAGATAQCSDGSYSFSQSRRGTCSHHGGVGTWL